SPEASRPTRRAHEFRIFSNHDLTPHLQNYRNHLQNLRLLGAQIVVPIVLQGASGRRLSVLRQRHACGVSGHRSANAWLSAYPGTLPACSGCLPAAYGSSVPFRRHDGVTPEQAEAVEAVLTGPFYDGPYKVSGAATMVVPLPSSVWTARLLKLIVDHM